MKNALKLIAVVIVIGLAALYQAEANLFTFDDLPDSFPGYAIPNGYGGLDWGNFYELDGVNINAYYGISASGYANGVVSANNVAFNNFGNTAITSASTPFNLVSGYFTGAFNNNLTLSVQAYNGSSLIYSQTYSLNATSSQFITFGMNNITEVDFSSYGGYNAGLNYGSGTQFVMDNLTVVPVPEPAALALAGLSGLMLLFRWQRK
jgi:hypothetical protein